MRVHAEYVMLALVCAFCAIAGFDRRGPDLVFVMGMALGVGVAAHYAIRRFRFERRLRRLGTRRSNSYQLQIDRSLAATLFPIRGEGPCAISIECRAYLPHFRLGSPIRMALAFSDERGIEPRSLYLDPEDKHDHEANYYQRQVLVEDASNWSLRVRFTASSRNHGCIPVSIKIETRGSSASLEIPEIWDIEQAPLQETEH
jgi:hypothetical protein